MTNTTTNSRAAERQLAGDAKSDFQFTRLTGGEKLTSASLSDVLQGDIAAETWLFVAPHDDDLCLGGGLLMQAAVQAGAAVHALIVTDGCMGYCTAEQQHSIAELRRRETFESFDVLGVSRDRVAYIDYPDNGLSAFLGRRRAHGAEPAIAGYVGLQNAFTYHLRDIRPDRVFTPTSADLHPDHRITHSELMISLFHASGKIWPELGDPINTPQVYELAVYCDFPAPPNLEIRGSDDAFAAKLKSIEAFRSQLQIDALVASVRNSGPFEYVRELNFRLYSPQTYRSLFQ